MPLVNNILKNIILQFALDFTNDMIKIFKNMIEDEMDFTEIILEIKKKTYELGAKVAVLFIEELDKIIKEDKKRQEKWVVERKDKKTIITLLGTIEYERTYYKSKKDGRYTYLVDDALGINRHERIDKGVKIKLVENARLVKNFVSGGINVLSYLLRVFCKSKVVVSFLKNGIYKPWLLAYIRTAKRIKSFLGIIERVNKLYLI